MLRQSTKSTTVATSKLPQNLTTLVPVLVFVCALIPEFYVGEAPKGRLGNGKNKVSTSITR